MLHFRTKFKPILLLLPVGLGIVLIAVLGLALSAGRPVQAQPPADEVYPPELMVMEPRAVDQDPPLRVSVNYADDIIEEGYAMVGSTIRITVTNAAGDVKATAQMVTQQIPWWGPGQFGFSTALGNPWVPAKPDIIPGDWVHASSTEGYQTSVRVGEIDSTISVDTDRVTGTIDAPWLLPGDVEVKCRAYNPVTQEDAQVFDMPAGGTIPDGTSTFTCDFAAAGWDLNPGQLVAISYDAEGPAIRSNRILNVFRVPGPYLQIKAWASGAAGIGGNMVLNVEYRNRGTQPATGVQITGVLTNLTYLSATEDASSGGGTGPIVWNLGTVEVDDLWTRFQVFVNVTGGVGQTAAAQMDITSSPAPNMGAPSERTSTWSGSIQDNGAWFTISKSAWTRYPVPNNQFVYTLNVCNAVSPYAVDSSTATVTDTLPSDTTLVSWWGAEEGWSQVSASPNQLVISRPSIASHGCTEVYVRVALAGGLAEGHQLCNYAIVTADNHTVNTANEITWCHTVGAPRPNLAINKEWNCGELVPGGRLLYNIIVQNTGNVPVTGPILITDTLPPFTTFNHIRFYENQPFTFPIAPVSTANGQVVWQVDGIDNGYWTKFIIELDVDPDAPVGTWVENTIAIGRAGLVEQFTTDNVATWREQIYAPGPNLRVTKRGTWDDWGTGTRRLSYSLDVENVGDEVAHNVVVTDTYDSRLTIDGSVQVDPGFNPTVVMQSAQNRFLVQFARMNPGDSIGIDFGAFASAGPVAPGLTFTNTAQITLLPGDSAPADNIAVVTNTSGPDLAITKTFLGGLVEAGEVITYALTFGNARGSNVWWWGLQGDAHVTDTLPQGMTFVAAQLCNIYGLGCVNITPLSNTNGTVTWNVGKLATGDWKILKVAARLPVGAEKGDVFVNRAEIASTSPTLDAEADTTNNVDTFTVRVGFMFENFIYMPLVTKNVTR